MGKAFSIRAVGVLLAITLAHPFLSALHGKEGCTACEETITLRTYPFFDPDPVPVLVTRPEIYPYFRFQGYTAEGEERAWRAVRLENAYVRVYVLPEAGGKVLGAEEKSTGRQFIYRNDVMKFREIALRGPWTSGGIEFNFGIMGHAPTTATPVDYLVRTAEDGSAECVVGCMDLPSRTRWSVTLRVSPRRAGLEVQTLWYNPTPFHQSYYAWTNSAVAVGEDLRFFLPGRAWIPHGYTVPPAPWPRDDEGRDLSRYVDNAFGGSKSYFVFGRYAGFFGGYWEKARFGFAHCATYDDLPGRKLWIWALSRQGAIWEGLLTDGAGQYCEPQAGRLLSQTDHRLFPPCTADRWKESFHPFREIGGLVKASPRAALNVERAGKRARIGVCALAPVEEEITVTCGGWKVLRETLHLDPMEVWRKEVDLPHEKGPLRVRLGDALDYTDDPEADTLHRPLPFRPVDGDTPEGRYRTGRFLEARRRYAEALETYAACTAREPLHLRAWVRMAELHGRAGAYEQGLACARRALELDAYDPDANFTYAVLARRRGDRVDALEAFGWAARAPQYRAAAYGAMAEILLAEGRYARALAYAERAVAYDPWGLDLHLVKAMALRKLGRKREAEQALEELLSLAPLYHPARFEAYLLDPSPNRLHAYQEFIRCELPHEEYLEDALLYVRLGQEEEALRLLEEGPPFPTLLYWQAYLLRHRDPAESRKRLRAAEACSPRMVFPFREESIAPFTWACEQLPEAWKPRWYRALVLWSKGRVDEARKLFQGLGPVPFAPFHLALAALDREHAEAHLREALAVDPGEWRAWHERARFLIAAKRREEALALTDKALARFPHSTPLAMDRARALYEAGRYGPCLERLDRLEVLPYEGAWEAHHLFVRAHLGRAMKALREGDPEAALRSIAASRAWPEHLGSGEPFDPDYRVQDALEAACREGMGDAGEAEKARKRILDYTLGASGAETPALYFGLVCLRKRHMEEEAARLLETYSRRHPGDPVADWLRAKLSGRREETAALEARLEADPRHALVVEVARFLESFAPDERDEGRGG